MAFLDQSFSIAQAAAQNRRDKIREKRVASGRQRTARPLKFPSLLSILPPVLSAEEDEHSDDEHEQRRDSPVLDSMFSDLLLRRSGKSLAKDFANAASGERRKSVRFSNRFDDSVMITEADENVEQAPPSSRKSGRKSGHMREDDSFGMSSADSSSSGFGFQRTPRKSTSAPAGEVLDDVFAEADIDAMHTEENETVQGQTQSESKAEHNSPDWIAPDSEEERARRPKKKKTSNKRRATQKIIDTAKQYRIVIDDEDDESAAHSSGNNGIAHHASDSVRLGSGRPKRLRIPPLEWWNNEEVVYQRKQVGVGVVVPVMAALKLGDGQQVSVDKLIEAQQQRSGNIIDRRISVATLKRPYSDTVDYTKLNKTNNNNSQPTVSTKSSTTQNKKPKPTSQQTEAEAKAEEKYSADNWSPPRSPSPPPKKARAKKSATATATAISPFPKPPSEVFAVLVPNSETKSLEERVLVKPICYDHLEELRQESEVAPDLDSTPNPKAKKKMKVPQPSPQGAKLFEESCFSTGELLLPPLSFKQREMAVDNFEVFTVLECEPNCVEVEYADSGKIVRLQVGHQFQIPPDATYSLKNVSRRIPAKLTFTLIRQQKPIDETEVQQRINQAVEERLKQMQMQSAPRAESPVQASPQPVTANKSRTQRKR